MKRKFSSGKIIGRPPKYKHGRALSGAERVRAMRAKQDLDKFSPESPQYKRAIKKLESIYSEGVNPHQKGALRTPRGKFIPLHGFGWESTPERKLQIKEEMKKLRQTAFSKAYLGGRPLVNPELGRAMSVSERVALHRANKKMEEQEDEEEE